MSTSASSFGSNALRDAQDFSLVLGGPLFQLMRRAHLVDDALLLLRRRIIAIALLAWLPLLVFSALTGRLTRGNVAVPFLLDIETHIRFLVVVPLLLAAELVVHERLHPIARAFLERNLIPEAAMPRFDAAVRSALRWRNSVLAEVLLLVAVYTVGLLIGWRQHIDLADSWYEISATEHTKLSLAGIWYAGVSLPIFQFLLLRWYFRLFIWTRFLWRVSRIRLNLVPTHPDCVGGLGLLTNTVYAFTVLLVAHGAMVAARIAGRILLGATLPEFKVEIAVVVTFLLCVVLGPLLLFAPQLAQAKRTGLLEYGTFAERYVREFDAKWLRGRSSGDEALLGSSDIQSLADMGNSFAVVRAMRLAPFTRDNFILLAVAVLAPIAPLVLTLMPLATLLKKLLGLVL
jgi:hypothetical protein